MSSGLSSLSARLLKKLVVPSADPIQICQSFQGQVVAVLLQQLTPGLVDWPFGVQDQTIEIED